jgi:hypothetical protein
MNALRAAVGRTPAADRAGELLDLAGRDDPVHLFDAYAMTNLRLCSAFRAGSTESPAGSHGASVRRRAASDPRAQRSP